MTAAAPEAIFFDMDGTILDWQAGMAASWQAACREGCANGDSVDANLLLAAVDARRDWFWAHPERSRVGRLDLDAATRRIVAHALADIGHDDEALAATIARDYRARRLAAMVPYPGAIHTLATLRSRGAKMALITNGGAASQRHSIERFGLAAYFDCIVIEGEFGCGKPDERIFRHALQSCGCQPEAAWMVGDNLHADIEAPRRLGMYTVWVRDPAGDVIAPPSGAQPHRTVRAIADLLDPA
ncbi:MAG: HAD family hydrolase [Dehalococcoidia bacterium]|nr:HAD family hydrolase [Dehalococcoidia bacterium]